MSQINYLYHSVEPDAVNQNGYTEFSTIDFSLDFAQRAMVAGSVRFEAEVRITDGNGADIADIAKVKCDHMVGGHSFVQSCVSSTLNSGILENATNLPRLHAMKVNSTEHYNDMNNAKNVCELKSSDTFLQEKLLKQRCPSDLGGGANGVGAGQHLGSGFGDATLYPRPVNDGAFENPDFSIKPDIVFNNVVSSNKLVNYSTTGTVKLSFNLARNAEALFGASMTAGHSYTLTNARVCFVSLPEQPKQAPVQLRSSICLKSNLNSNLASSSIRVPNICDSVSISFLSLARENSLFFNNTALEKPPNFDALRMNFNSSTNKYLAYELKTIPEIVGEGLKSLANGSGSNNVSLDKLAVNKGFIAGLKFGEFVDLSKQSFQIQVQSGIQNANPMVMFSYFHSLIAL